MIQWPLERWTLIWAEFVDRLDIAVQVLGKHGCNATAPSLILPVMLLTTTVRHVLLYLYGSFVPFFGSLVLLNLGLHLELEP